MQCNVLPCDAALKLGATPPPKSPNPTEAAPAGTRVVAYVWDDASQTVRAEWKAAPVPPHISWGGNWEGTVCTPAALWAASFSLPAPENSFFRYWTKYKPSEVAEALRITAKRLDFIKHDNKSTGSAMYASGCLKLMQPSPPSQTASTWKRKPRARKPRQSSTESATASLLLETSTGRRFR